jgi:hypothetical protein
MKISKFLSILALSTLLYSQSQAGNSKAGWTITSLKRRQELNYQEKLKLMKLLIGGNILKRSFPFFGDIVFSDPDWK